MKNLQSTSELINIFDHRSAFDLSVDASDGAVFIAAFSSEKEFHAVAVNKKFSQSLDEIVKFIQSIADSTPNKSVDLRIVGNTENVANIESRLLQIGLTLCRKAIRDCVFLVRYNPTVGRIEVSSDQSPSHDNANASAAPPPRVIKVLIVDDSVSVTLLLKRVIESDPAMAVVGTCRRPSEVDAMVETLKPDVITMDIQMPEMDGPTLVKKIFSKYQKPIVMISSISREEGSQVLESLENGAVDYIQKPSLRPIPELAEIIVPRLKAASNAKTTDHSSGRATAQRLGSRWDPNYVIAIGSSTGGVEALKRLLTSFPTNIPPTVIAHHIPSVFSETLAVRLNSYVTFQISEAKDGDILKKNHVYIAPGGYDMKITQKGTDLVCQIQACDPGFHYHPSVDLLFDSVARHCGSRTIGIILTGMGRDGAEGMVRLKQAGAWNIAQDESSCVVYGMPKAAVELGAANLVLHIDEIAKHIDRKIKI
jgi:two-component system chemotaxis response regulator CheB